MRVLKFLFGLLAFLLIAYLILCLIGPKQSSIDVERNTTIDAPVATVFNNVNDFSQWKKWSYWHGLDPEMKIEYGDIKTGTGAWYKWESGDMNVGKGRMETVEYIPNEFIKNKMEFDDTAPSYPSFKFEAIDDSSTKVSWDMKTDFEVPFMQRGMMKFMDMNQMIGTAYEKSLANLKNLSEGN